jgi:hypothetical protein
MPCLKLALSLATLPRADAAVAQLDTVTFHVDAMAR